MTLGGSESCVTNAWLHHSFQVEEPIPETSCGSLYVMDPLSCGLHGHMPLGKGSLYPTKIIQRHLGSNVLVLWPISNI